MIRYKLYQNTREGSKTLGKWYGRATMTGEVKLNALSQRIQSNCTAKKSDVLAVLTELVEVMTDELQAGHRVVLDGFGSFKVGMRTTPADSAKDFTPSKNVKSLHVLFQPELKKSADGTRMKTFLTGAQVGEYGQYEVDKTEPEP